MKYRKKPVVIEAIQFNPPKDSGNLFRFEHQDGVEDFVIQGDDSGKYLLVHTKEGAMRANSHDWIIRGIKGEFYPCQPDIFEATYEAA